MESPAKRLRSTSTAVPVVVVGCGCPGRGMGWYHLTQLLEMPEAQVTGVVEPWYLGPGKDSPGAEKFRELQAKLEARGVAFHATAEDLPISVGKTLAVIAGRAAENPKLFRQCIEKRVTHIYLEKPGASSAGELETMRQQAATARVQVYLGYNKNVTKYVLLAREVAARLPGAEVTFIHNNAFTGEELPECFSRNREGIIKNMIVHELALLVTYYNVSCESVQSLEVLREECDLRTLGDFTDFVKLAFKVVTKQGQSITIKADRCGGSSALAIVSVKGEERFRSVTPDAELKARMTAQQAAAPDVLPYFFLQSDDYLTLKQRVLSSVVSGEPAEGIATIDIAVETLKAADMLNQQIRDAFS